MPNGTTGVEEIDALFDSMEKGEKKGKISPWLAFQESLDEIDPPAGQTPIPKPPPFAGGGVKPPEEPGPVTRALGGLGGLLTPAEEEEQVPVTGLAPVEELQETFREQRPPVEQAAPLRVPFHTELKKQAPKAAQIQAGISTAISKPATEEQKQRLREIRDDADRLLDQIGQMAAIEQETVQQVLGVPSGPRFAGPKVSEKKAKEVQLLDIARKFLLRTKTLDPDDTGFVAAVRRKVGEPARLLPFISSILEASELAGVLEAARKEQKGEKLTEIEELLLDSFANYASAEEAFKPGLLDEATAGAIGITTFATEFIATTPLFALGRRSATKLLLEVVKRRVRAKVAAGVAQRVAEKAVKRVPARLAAGFVGGVAQAVALPQTIPETVRRQIPKLRLSASKDGLEALQRIDRGPGEKFSTALTKAFGLTVVESVSERTGGVVQKPLNFLSRKMRGFTKGRFFDLWLKGRGLSKVDEATKKIAEAAAWNGIVGEVFEEQVAKPFRNIIEGDPLFTGFTMEQFATEVLSFAMFGSLAKGMGFSARAVERVAQARGEKPPTLAKPKVEALPKPAPVSAEEAAELGVEPERVGEVRKRKAEFEGPTEAAKRRQPPKKPTLIVREQPGAAVAGAAEEREPTRVPAPAAPGAKKVAAPKEPTPAAPAPKKIRLRDNVQFTTSAGVQVVGVVERISGEILSIRDQESGKIVTAPAKNVVLAGAKPLPTIPAVPEKRAKPLPVDFKEAATGKPFTAKLLQGTERTDIGRVYAEGAAGVPILGSGRYTTPSRKFAKFFGPKVQEVEVKLENPLVITNDVQWGALTKRAGWEFPNPVRFDEAGKAKARKEISDLRAMLEREGHDGVVIRLSRVGDEAKTLGKVFGEDTTIEFAPPKVSPPTQAVTISPWHKTNPQAKKHLLPFVQDFLESRQKKGKPAFAVDDSLYEIGSKFVVQVTEGKAKLGREGPISKEGFQRIMEREFDEKFISFNAAAKELFDRRVGEKVEREKAAEVIRVEEEKKEATERESRADRQAIIQAEFARKRFTTKTVELRMGEGKPPFLATGASIGGLIVHRRPGVAGKSARVSHIASGLSIWPRFGEGAPLHDAQLAMMRLSKLTDWTKSEKEILADKELMKRAGEWAKLLEEDLFAALPGEKLAAPPKPAAAPAPKVGKVLGLPPELPKGEKLPADFKLLAEGQGIGDRSAFPTTRGGTKAFLDPTVAKRLSLEGFLTLGEKKSPSSQEVKLTKKGLEAAKRFRASERVTETAEERAEVRGKLGKAIQLQADESLPPDKFVKAALEPIRQEYIKAFGGLDNYKAAIKNFSAFAALIPKKYQGKFFRIKIPGTPSELLIVNTPAAIERVFKKGPAAFKPFATPRRVPFAPRRAAVAPAVRLSDREALVQSLQSEIEELIKEGAEDDVVKAAEENLDEARRLLKEPIEPKKAGGAGAVEGLRVPFVRPPRREAAGRLKEIRQKMKSGVASKSEVIESVRIQGTPGGADTLQGEMHPLGFRPEQALEKLPESVQLQVQPTQTKAKKDLLTQVTELLDVPIRVGNFSQRTARAIFKRKPEVIRERMAEDVRARIHEIGHAINKILWGVTPFGTLNWRPLAPFRKELKGIATPARPGASPLPEGFAEFVALWVVEPSIVKAKTPKFLAFWDKELSSPDPFIVKLREALIDARDNVRIWRTATPRARLRAHINRDERTTRRLTANQLYTMYVDRLDPINRAVQGMAQKAGEPLPPTDENAYALARLFSGWAGKANYFVRTRTFDRQTRRDTGESLADILRDVGTKNLENFYDYLVAKRVIEKSAQGIATGIELQDAKAVVQELESPEFLKFKERRLAWSREVLRYGEGVLYTPEQRAQMEKMNEDYVPFFRVMEKEIAAGLGDTFTNLWNPVKRMKGSGRQIIDPAESDIKNAFTIINLTERARVLQSLVAQAQKTDGAGRWVEGPIPAPNKPTTFELSEIKRSLADAHFDVKGATAADLQVLATVFRPSAFKPNEAYIAPVLRPDGKRQWFRFDPDLFQAVSGLDHSGAGALIRLLGAPVTKVITAPARILRTGATSLGPEFMVTNPQRDTVTAFIQSEYGFVPVIDTVRGAFHVAKRSEMFNEFVKGGGEFAAIAGLDRKNVVATIRDLTETGIFKQIIRHPIESARAFSDTMEKATRLGEFIRARGKGATIPTASLAGRDVSLDFAKGGSKTFALNQLIAFFRAQINGMDVMLRKFKNNPTRTALKSALIVTLPSFLLYLVNRDDEEYKLQPRWIKDFFWLIPTGNPNVPFVPIRKPFVYGQIFGSIPERIWEWIDTKDPRAFDQLLESIFNSGFPELIPTFATPLIEWIANLNIFTDRPLVPQGREKVAPEFRVKPFTTETVKLLARIPTLVGLEAVSPAKLENLITGYTAGLGRAVLQASDEVLRRVRGLPELPTRLPGELPFVRAFAVRPAGLNAEPIKIFFDRMEEMERHRGTAQLVLKGERVPKQFVRTAVQQEETLGEFRKVRRQVSEIRTMMGLIRQSPKITGDKKREMIRRLERAAIALTIDVQTRFPERPTKVQPKKPRVPFTQSGRQR